MARDRSENRYRDLMAKAPIGQACLRPRGLRLLEINEAGAALIGYTPEELIGAPGRRVLLAEDRSAADGRADGASCVEGEIASFEIEHELAPPRRSRPIWVANNITVERDADGEPLHFHSLTIDITERKRAEAQLRSSEARYRKLIDEAPVGQLVSRLDGELVEVNQAFLDMMGETREEAFARERPTLLHPDDAGHVLEDDSPACCPARSTPSTASGASCAPTARRCG